MIHVNPDWRKILTDNKDLVKWAASRPETDFMTLWDETIDPVWLPHLAKAGGATHKQVVFALCAVVRLCLHLVPEGENRPRITIETTEAWCKGEATEEQVKETAGYNPNSRASRAAYYAAHSAIYASNSAVYASNASAYNATACALLAGFESQLMCSTYRKHLVFERPPSPKRLTVWQRLAMGVDPP